MLLRTRNSAALLVARLTVGLVMLPHGLQKTLGLFDGPGFSATMESFTKSLSIPWVLALLAVLAESLGALGLIFGFLTRICALGIGMVMGVAIFKGGHRVYGFFMDWQNLQGVEGFEYHLLVIGACLALLIGGAGALSMDRALSKDDDD